MDKFIKSEFNWDGMYLTYGPDRKFIARFKYRRVPFTKAQFLKQLIRNHTPAEYFATYAAGTAPLEILRLKDQAWHDAVIQKWKAKVS